MKHDPRELAYPADPTAPQPEPKPWAPPPTRTFEQFWASYNCDDFGRPLKVTKR